MRHDLEPSLLAPVDACGEVRVVAGELRLVAHEPAHVVVPLACHRGDGVTVLLGGVDDVGAELRPQP